MYASGLGCTFAKALFCRRRRRAPGAFEGLPALKPVFDSPYAALCASLVPGGAEGGRALATFFASGCDAGSQASRSKICCCGARGAAHTRRPAPPRRAAVGTCQPRVWRAPPPRRLPPRGAAARGRGARPPTHPRARARGGWLGAPRRALRAPCWPVRAAGGGQAREVVRARARWSAPPAWRPLLGTRRGRLTDSRAAPHLCSGASSRAPPAAARRRAPPRGAPCRRTRRTVVSHRRRRYQQAQG